VKDPGKRGKWWFRGGGKKIEIFVGLVGNRNSGGNALHENWNNFLTENGKGRGRKKSGYHRLVLKVLTEGGGEEKFETWSEGPWGVMRRWGWRTTEGGVQNLGGENALEKVKVWSYGKRGLGEAGSRVVWCHLQGRKGSLVTL